MGQGFSHQFKTLLCHAQWPGVLGPTFCCLERAKSLHRRRSDTARPCLIADFLYERERGRSIETRPGQNGIRSRKPAFHFQRRRELPGNEMHFVWHDRNVLLFAQSNLSVEPIIECPPKGAMVNEGFQFAGRGVRKAPSHSTGNRLPTMLAGSTNRLSTASRIRPQLSFTG